MKTEQTNFTKEELLTAIRVVRNFQEMRSLAAEAANAIRKAYMNSISRGFITKEEDKTLYEAESILRRVIGQAAEEQAIELFLKDYAGIKQEGGAQ